MKRDFAPRLILAGGDPLLNMMRGNAKLPRQGGLVFADGFHPIKKSVEARSAFLCHGSNMDEFYYSSRLIERSLQSPLDRITPRRHPRGQMEDPFFPLYEAQKLEKRAAALIIAAWIFLGLALLLGFVALVKALGADEYRTSLIAAAACIGLAIVPFSIAQIYAVRAHLLRILAAKEHE